MTTQIYTDGGSVNSAHGIYGGWGYVVVANEKAIKAEYGNTGCVNGTNNLAELCAFYSALYYVRDVKLKKVDFFLDSEYVIDGITKYVPNWIKNNWVKSNGEEVKNTEMWKIINTLYTDLLSSGYELTLSHVKAHSGNTFNEMADKLATKALKCSLRGEEGVFSDSIETISVIKPKAKTKKIQPNKFLAGRRVLCVSNKEIPLINGESMYVITSYDDTTKVKAAACGGDSGDGITGAVLSKNRCSVIDALIRKQNEIVSDDIYVPIIYYWDKITSAKNWAVLSESLNDLQSDKHKSFYLNNGTTQISHVCNTPRLAFRPIEEANTLLDIMQYYKEGRYQGNDSVDINDLIFTANDKGVKVINPELSKVKYITTKVKVNDDKEMKVRLTLGDDIPNRNQLAAMLKQEKDLNVKLLVTARPQGMIIFAVVIESENNTGCYKNKNTCLRTY